MILSCLIYVCSFIAFILFLLNLICIGCCCCCCCCLSFFLTDCVWWQPSFVSPWPCCWSRRSRLGSGCSRWGRWCSGWWWWWDYQPTCRRSAWSRHRRAQGFPSRAGATTAWNKESLLLLTTGLNQSWGELSLHFVLYWFGNSWAHLSTMGLPGSTVYLMPWMEVPSA